MCLPETDVCTVWFYLASVSECTLRSSEWHTVDVTTRDVNQMWSHTTKLQKLPKLSPDWNLWILGPRLRHNTSMLYEFLGCEVAHFSAPSYSLTTYVPYVTYIHIGLLKFGSQRLD